MVTRQISGMPACPTDSFDAESQTSFFGCDAWVQVDGGARMDESAVVKIFLKNGSFPVTKSCGCVHLGSCHYVRSGSSGVRNLEICTYCLDQFI